MAGYGGVLETEKTLIQILSELIPAGAFALFGGFIELMRHSEKAKVNASFVVSSLCAAAFIGMVVGLLLYDSEMSQAMKGATVGVAGASSRTVMEILKTRIIKLIGGIQNGQ